VPLSWRKIPPSPILFEFFFPGERQKEVKREEIFTAEKDELKEIKINTNVNKKSLMAS